MLYDSWGYWRIAENLGSAGIFSQGSENSLMPDSIRTPLYPFFIFLLRKFFFGFYGIILTQLIISSATASFCAFITEQVLNNKKAGIFAGIFLALDFPSIFFANTLMTETLFTFLLLTSFYFFISYFKNQKKKMLIFSAIFSGLTILCRPIAIYLPVIFAVSILFARPPDTSQLIPDKARWKPGPFRFSKIKNLSVFLFISYLVISPWVFRNYLTFGSPFFSTIGDINLLSYTTAAIRAEKENKTLFEIQQEYKKISSENFNWEKPEEIVRFAGYCREETYRIIREYPLAFVKNQSASFASFFIKPLRNYIDLQLGITKKYNSITGLPGKAITANTEKIFENTSTFALILVISQVILLLIIAFFSLVHFLRKEKSIFPFALAILIIFYFAILAGFTEVDARMRIPVMPFLSFFAGSGALLFTIKAQKTEK